MLVLCMATPFLKVKRMGKMPYNLLALFYR